jgi:hypothetical protein
VEKSERTRVEVIELLKRCLDEGRTIEIDGLGRFRPRQGGFEFVAHTEPSVFIAYVEEDAAAAQKLYADFKRFGFHAWLDREKLMPGQNWPRSIDRAISVSDFFVPCFSKHAAVKRGTFHSELRYALDYAATVPLEDIFIIPVRLEICEVPRRITREFQYVDLFPDWDAGVRRIVRSIERQMRLRSKERLAG